MSWLAVDKDTTEHIFNNKPYRDNIKNFYKNGKTHYFWASPKIYDKVKLPKGSIKKLIGVELGWDDAPIQLKI